LKTFKEIARYHHIKTSKEIVQYYQMWRNCTVSSDHQPDSIVLLI